MSYVSQVSLRIRGSQAGSGMLDPRADSGGLEGLGVARFLRVKVGLSGERLERV